MAALVAFYVLLLASNSVAFSEIISGSRAGPWQGNVGVPGGIPNRTKIYKNIVTDLGADPTGAKDCSSIIQGAIDKCPSGQVVYLPEGIFRVETPVHVDNKKSNRTLRGAGMGRTTLIGAKNNPIFTAG